MTEFDSRRAREDPVPRPWLRPRRVGDEAEYRDLFEAVHARVARTVWFVVHDEQVAQEITQDAFFELFRNWDRVRAYERPDLWVRRVALRKAQREAVRTGRRGQLERRATEPVAQQPLPDQELLDAIATLPPRQRAVVVLFYLEDRPMEEVADLVGCSTATGFVHLHKARRRLAELLSEEVEGDVD